VRRIKDWLWRLYTNRCCDCPCGWSDVGPEDSDQGCYVFRHFGARHCPYAFLPNAIKLFLRNRVWRRDAKAQLESARKKIKPCPCCGREARVWEVAGDNVFVRCSNISKCGLKQEWFDDEQEAIDAWNKRPLVDCQRAGRTQNGKCIGYQRSLHDDEPCEICSNCERNQFYDTEGGELA